MTVGELRRLLAEYPDHHVMVVGCGGVSGTVLTVEPDVACHVRITATRAPREKRR